VLGRSMDEMEIPLWVAVHGTDSNILGFSSILIICDCLRRRYAAGGCGVMAETESSSGVRREHRSGQDHFLVDPLPRFPETISQSSLFEAHLYRTTGRGR